MIALGVLLFCVALALGLPVAFALLLASAPTFLTGEYLPSSIAVQKMIGATQSFPLMAIPFFVVAGNVMTASGIAGRLVEFSRVLVGWLAGGLAQISIVLSFLMGGISGSAVADAAMQARLLGAPMIQRGYAPGYAASVITFSSIITATIPPSIGLIVYGFVANVSVGRLLLAGIVPGVILTAALMAYTFASSRRRGFEAAGGEPPSWGDVLRTGRRAVWALLFPLILVVGFRFGIFTATEAGAFVIFYALAVGAFLHRELTWQNLHAALVQSLSDIGMIMLIIVMAAVVGYVIVLEQAPTAVASGLAGLTESPTATLLVILAFLVLAGAVMEATVNVLLLTPLFTPVLVAQGHDPVHFGVLMIVIINMGSNTPPIGVSMFSVCGMLKVPLKEYVRESLPFLAVMLGVILLLAFMPDLVLWLPSAVMG